MQYGHPSCDEFIGLLRNHVFRSICSPLNVIAFFVLSTSHSGLLYLRTKVMMMAGRTTFDKCYSTSGTLKLKMLD